MRRFSGLPTQILDPRRVVIYDRNAGLNVGAEAPRRVSFWECGLRGL